uniref:28 kDa Metastriate family member n=1 Tax=Rhipicephalus zambeziensis TaxID=60191 RepID=A0A224YHD8_9ACAR
MKPAYFLVFCLFVSLLKGRLSYTVSTPWAPVGDGIKAEVKVYYDTEYVTTEENISDHFTTIFSQIQRELHKNLVMVNLTVNSTQKNDSLRVFEHDNVTVNGNATLDVLKKLLQSEPNNTIGYYFTGRNINETKERRADDIYTLDTFCTSNPTATVLQSLQFPGFYLTAYKETIFMLGSRHTPKPHNDDYERMNQTFRRCTGTIVKTRQD